MCFSADLDYPDPPQLSEAAKETQKTQELRAKNNSKQQQGRREVSRTGVVATESSALVVQAIKIPTIVPA